MKSKELAMSIVAGAVIAFGAGIPVAQATAPDVRQTMANAHAAQALIALNARWNAQAEAYRASQARLAAERALKAVDDRWNAQAEVYETRLADAQALEALNARWNAQAVFFGLR